MSLLAKEVNRINIGTLLVLLTQATGLVVMVLPWLLSYLGLSYQVCKIWIFLWECGYSLGLERWSGEWRAGIAFIGKDKWKFVIDSDIPNLQMKTWYSSKMWQAKWPRWRDELNKRPRSIFCLTLWNCTWRLFIFFSVTAYQLLLLEEKHCTENSEKSQSYAKLSNASWSLVSSGAAVFRWTSLNKMKCPLQ